VSQVRQRQFSYLILSSLPSAAWPEVFPRLILFVDVLDLALLPAVHLRLMVLFRAAILLG
jgi:hypothetical protein